MHSKDKKSWLKTTYSTQKERKDNFESISGEKVAPLYSKEDLKERN